MTNESYLEKNETIYYLFLKIHVISCSENGSVRIELQKGAIHVIWAPKIMPDVKALIGCLDGYSYLSNYSKSRNCHQKVMNGQESREYHDFLLMLPEFKETSCWKCIFQVANSI